MTNIKQLSAPIETDYTQEPVCPYCGNIETDAWEINFGGIDGGTEHNCGSCDGEYFVQRNAIITYSTHKIKDTPKMNNIEKLAKTHCIGTYQNSEDGERFYFRLQDLEAFAKALQQSSEPVAYCVYFPDEPRQEYCQSLDELTDALTNERHEITPLFTHPPATVPEGFQLVPIEPTAEMVNAFKQAFKQGSIWTDRMTTAVEAMLSASPTPPNAVPLEKYNRAIKALKLSQSARLKSDMSPFEAWEAVDQAIAEAEGKV